MLFFQNLCYLCYLINFIAIVLPLPWPPTTFFPISFPRFSVGNQFLAANKLQTLHKSLQTGSNIIKIKLRLMKKQMASIFLVLLIVHVSSALVNFTPVYLSVVQPSEYYYEVASFTSQNDNTWRNYGNLNKTVILANDQYVDISYDISGDVSSGTGHILGRILINGVERREFRSISGNTNYVHLFIFNRVFLPAGNHFITLQYRTPFTINANTTNDWKIGYLKLIY